MEESDVLYQMSNLRHGDTGLPMNIIVSHCGYAKYGPRIKVQRNLNPKGMDDLFSVQISKTPHIVAGDLGDITNRQLEKVFKYILLNLDPMLDFWYGRIELSEFLGKLQKFS